MGTVEIDEGGLSFRSPEELEAWNEHLEFESRGKIARGIITFLAVTGTSFAAAHALVLEEPSSLIMAGVVAGAGYLINKFIDRTVDLHWNNNSVNRNRNFDPGWGDWDSS